MKNCEYFCTLKQKTRIKMLKFIYRYTFLYISLIAIFILQRIGFVCCYYSSLGDISFSEILSAMYAGLSLDASMSGYLTVLPLLLGVVRLGVKNKSVEIVEKVYYGIVAFIISLVTVLDIALYSYWGFRLDMTPLFYFFSSPSSAMASATIGETILSLAIFAILTFSVWKFLTVITSKFTVTQLTGGFKSKIGAVAIVLLMFGLLFLSIRGGVTVSTMNLSRAYFSQNQKLNHVAINPQFSLMYSATHQSNFKEQYRFLDEKEASTVFTGMQDKTFELNDSLLNTQRPDIYLIIAESFSSQIMPSLGGEDIAIRLDSIANEGVLFTNFYANSFRTDRAIPAILSGFPSQPNTSIMKYVEKAEHLPSLPKTLKANGYDVSYYYGGDINFTNMLAYLVSQGFEHIIKDKDFTVSERKSKWGAHDDVLFRRVFDELKEYSGTTPQFRVIQTSSSHEPFEVPYKKKLKVKYPDQENRANAFAYADSCIGDFVDKLKVSGKWNNSLVIITPDHYGAYPKSLDNVLERHRIPLVLAGGVLQKTGVKISTVGCQTDIVATVLSALGISSNDFKYSKNIFSHTSPHFAFFTEPEYMGIVKDSAYIVYNLDASRIDGKSGDNTDILEKQAKAYLQTVYNDLEDL